MAVIPKREIKVVKSNSLVQAKYRLSIQEQRILLLAICQIKKDEIITEDQLYSVYARDLVDLTGIDANQAYKELKAAALKLKRREVSIFEGPNGSGKHKSTWIVNWVQSVRYIPGEGRVDLRFNYDMIPYINQLTSEFTEFFMLSSANNAFKMNSTYGYRLYEILMQWKSVGYREIEVQWLRDIFDLPESYKLLADLKKRVVEPALRDINEHTPYWVNVSQIKSGRTVTHLCFTFGLKSDEKPKRKRGRPKKINVYDDKFLAENAKPGETRDQAINRLKELHNA